jgi:hypothetical protein
MAGKMCATEAALLNSGMSKRAVCVESIVCPFGNLAVKGLLATFLFKHGIFFNKKCSVHLESTRAVSLLLSRGAVQQSSNFSLFFLAVAPKSQSMLVLEPPMFFVLVASLWCPSLVYMQVWCVWVCATL